MESWSSLLNVGGFLCLLAFLISLGGCGSSNILKFFFDPNSGVVLLRFSPFQILFSRDLFYSTPAPHTITFIQRTRSLFMYVNRV